MISIFEIDNDPHVISDVNAIKKQIENKYLALLKKQKINIPDHYKKLLFSDDVSKFQNIDINLCYYHDETNNEIYSTVGHSLLGLFNKKKDLNIFENYIRIKKDHKINNIIPICFDVEGNYFGLKNIRGSTKIVFIDKSLDNKNCVLNTPYKSVDHFLKPINKSIFANGPTTSIIDILVDAKPGQTLFGYTLGKTGSTILIILGSLIAILKVATSALSS